MSENYRLSILNFIFCSDEYLLTLNQKYLAHDTYTDIITFNNSDTEGEVMGDIFISVNQVFKNAQKFQVLRSEEMCRMLIHGTLHLIGYRDKTKSDKIKMTAKEDEYLNLIKI